MKIDKSIPVIERWEAEGCLDGVQEGNKKYLSDLYDALYDKIVNMPVKDKAYMVSRFQMETLGICDNNETIDSDLNDLLLEFFIPVMRRVYETNQKLSIIEFWNCLSDIDVDNLFLNENIHNTNTKHNTLTVTERLGNYIVEKLNDCINTRY